MLNIIYTISLFILFLYAPVKIHAEEGDELPPIISPKKFKEAPKRLKTESNVMIESHEIIEPCDPEKICIEGLLYNDSLKPAYDVKIKVNLGASKAIKPRTSMIHLVDEPIMQPGDRQEFSLLIPRKFPYRYINNEEKILEVGKYNFQLVPLWNSEKIRPRTKKWKKP